jgi:hypothetical protein
MVLALMTIFAGVASADYGYADPPRPAWIKGAYGYEFAHLNNVSDNGIDAAANAIDVNAVAEQAKQLGVRMVSLQLGWTTGTYSTHNAIYDSICLQYVGHRLTPSRDLFSELADALHARGIQMYTELASDGPKSYSGKNGAWWAAVDQNWCRILDEWFRRWGAKVDGYWIDGSYWNWHMDCLVSTLNKYVVPHGGWYCMGCGEKDNPAQVQQCLDGMGDSHCIGNHFYAWATGNPPNVSIPDLVSITNRVAALDKSIIYNVSEGTSNQGPTSVNHMILLPPATDYFAAVRDSRGGPARITTGPPRAYINVPYTYRVRATGLPAPTISASGLPSWLSFDASTATFSGTPTSLGTSGTITVTATNSLGSDQQNFAITVFPPGDGTGLNGEYYSNIDLTGPILTRNDTTVNFNWGLGSPSSSIAVDGFSVRWTGMVQPRYSEMYTFFTATDDGARLWVDDKLIIDKWVNQAVTEYSGTIALTADRKYSIKMEYYDNTHEAVARLSWSSTSQLKEIVPKMQLFASATPVVERKRPTTAVSGSQSSVMFTPQGRLVTIGQAGGPAPTLRPGVYFVGVLTDKKPVLVRRAVVR